MALVCLHQQNVLCELVVQKVSGVFAKSANNAQMGQGGNAVKVGKVGELGHA
jgi:hypothetical protein